MDRKLWNEKQQILRTLLEDGSDHLGAIQLFLEQHAVLHSALLAQTSRGSFEDEIWQGLSEAHARRIPRRVEHSIAWIFWHLARIEDVTMNLLLAGSPQVLEVGGWLPRLRTAAKDTGNAMSFGEMQELSITIDLPALRAYRLAVGRRTREAVSQLSPPELQQKVQPARLQRVLDEGAVVAAAQEVIDYWGGLTITGLLLMPPTRHNLIHLNEAERLKERVKK